MTAGGRGSTSARRRGTNKSTRWLTKRVLRLRARTFGAFAGLLEQLLDDVGVRLRPARGASAPVCHAIRTQSARAPAAKKRGRCCSPRGRPRRPRGTWFRTRFRGESPEEPEPGILPCPGTQSARTGASADATQRSTQSARGRGRRAHRCSLAAPRKRRAPRRARARPNVQENNRSLRAAPQLRARRPAARGTAAQVRTRCRSEMKMVRN
jgi:hypothetical protein